MKGADPFDAVEAERSAVEERVTRFEDPAARSFRVIAGFRLWQSPEPLVATRVPKRLIHVKLLARWESEQSWTASSEHPLNGHSPKKYLKQLGNVLLLTQRN